MKVLAAPSPTPAPTGRLREWNGGVPGHGEFVMLKTQPTDGSAPLEFSSKFGSRLWMSPGDELPPTVSGEACTLRQLIRQGTFPGTGTSHGRFGTTDQGPGQGGPLNRRGMRGLRMHAGSLAAGGESTAICARSGDGAC